MKIDRIAFDLPLYEGLLAGHYVRGQGYGRRRPGGTDDWLLIMTVGGKGRFGSGAGDVYTKPPSLVLVAPGITHEYGTAPGGEEWDLLWVHFQPPAAWLELLRWPLVAPGIHAFEPNDSAAIEQAFRELVNLSVSITQRARQFAMNALERLLLLCDEQLPSQDVPWDERVRQAVAYIHEHLRRPLTLAELSASANLSPSRFAHLFRAETGLPPRQYVLQQRLHRARTLLERTPLGIAEIAHEIGMDPFYLSIRFKSETGLSPREFRKRSQL